MDAQLTAIQPPINRVTSITAAFAASLFTSAALLFWVQPLIAKMLLPLLGGAASVWNTCMVFFQAGLLAGYAYALIVSKYLRPKNQALLHITLSLVAGLWLPFAISERAVNSLPTQTNPTFWLVGVLLLTVGPPFFVLSATAPLLQRWFSHTAHKSAKDPYFLYAVSNAGSMLSLLAFPFLLEPTLTIRMQTRTWAIGYLILTALITCCAIVLKGGIASATSTPKSDVERLGTKRFQWVILAFIPSSLMLGVTTYISTDVAPMPLIWIIPLTLYLLTFILAFANGQIISLRIASLLLPLFVVLLAFFIIVNPKIWVWVPIGMHLAIFFLAAFICHRRLAISRPPVARLAEYFLWLAIGGVLGGIFNALLAPRLFSRTIEYPAVIILACMMRPVLNESSRAGRWLRLALPVVVLLVTVALSLLIPRFGFSQGVQNALVLFVPLLLSLTAVRQPVVFALSLAAVWIGTLSYLKSEQSVLAIERNFYGIWQVTKGNDGVHRLRHGSTLHGAQFPDAERKCVATTYFHKEGPLGQFFKAFDGADYESRSNHVAAVGLGAGTVATYSEAGQLWYFYELDPTVVKLASTPSYFKYLSECAKAPYQIVLGDARLRLQEAPAGHFAVIILDAFSSDSVPAHLLTAQAIDLYLSKLAPDGLIAFHISNRYLNLEPLLSGLSRKAGLSARINRDAAFDSDGYRYPSTWVVMARKESNLGGLAKDQRWRSLNGDVVWSDDFSNIFQLLK